MKIYHTKYYLLLSLFLVAACKDDTINDEEIPVITLILPEADKKVWFDVSVKAEVSDNQEIVKVAFYVDDAFVEEVMEAPYEISWNARAYEDGKHTIRCVAYDHADNQAEVVKEVEVFNKLFKVTVEENRYRLDEDTEEKGWVIIADTIGNVIQTEELKNGTEVAIDRPADFLEGAFNLSFVKIINNSYGEYYFLTTYQNISPNAWLLKGSNVESGGKEQIGSAKFSFNMPEGSYKLVSSEGGWKLGGHDTGGFNEYTVDIGIYENSIDAYLWITPNLEEVPVYKFYTNVQPGDNYSFGFDEFEPLNLIKTINLPDNQRIDLRMNGMNDSENKPFYNVFSKNLSDGSSEVSVYFPEKLFDSYSYSLSITRENINYHSYGVGNLRDNYAFPEVGLKVEDNSLDSFHAISNYQADCMDNLWVYTENTDKFKMVAWNLFTEGDDGIISWKRHEIPDQILSGYPFMNEHLNDLKYNKSIFYNYDEIGSFEEYLENVFQKNDSDWGKNYESIYINAPFPEGGRVSKDKLRNAWQQR